MENTLTSDVFEARENGLPLTEEKMKLLIHSYGNDLLRLCTLYLKDRDLAEDALQDTYLKIWKSYPSYQGKASEKTWVTRIAINVCKSYLRTSWHTKVQVADVEELLGQSGDGYSTTDSGIDLIRDVLKLKEKYRVVILLYYYQELSVKEIAKATKQKESTVLSQLKRGREQLKRHLDGKMGGIV